MRRTLRRSQKTDLFIRNWVFNMPQLQRSLKFVCFCFTHFLYFCTMKSQALALPLRSAFRADLNPLHQGGCDRILVSQYLRVMKSIDPLIKNTVQIRCVVLCFERFEISVKLLSQRCIDIYAYTAYQHSVTFLLLKCMHSLDDSLIYESMSDSLSVVYMSDVGSECSVIKTHP